jgi:hypothetical protein
MNAYRLIATSATACAAGLSLAACSAGIITANPGTSPAASRTASSPAASPPAASPSTSASASPADTVHVNAPIGSFPIPQAGQVVYNISCPKQINIMLSPVTISQASAFYTSALPRAGYKITQSMTFPDTNNGAPGGMVMISFTGHGYTGGVTAMTNIDAGASPIPSMGDLPSNMTKNVVEIMMSAPGTSESYICPA